MIRLFVVAVFFLLTGGYTLVKTFAVDGELHAVDQLGNVFSVNRSVLTKYDIKGEKQNVYSNKLLGNITSIDVSNTLRYLVFYQEMAKVVFLDNTLSLHNEVALEEYDFNQISLACSSNNDAFWIYNPVDYELIRMDKQIIPIQRTGNLQQIVKHTISPNFMREKFDRLYLNDPEKGVLIFDIYGNYIKTIPIKGIEHLDIQADRMYYLKANKLMSFNFKTLQETSLALPRIYSAFCLYGQKITLGLPNKVEVIELK